MLSKMYFPSLLIRKYVFASSSVRSLKFLSENYKQNIVSIKSKLDNVTLPERFKGTVVEKWSSYWKELYRDYYEVVRDSVVNAKTNPKKSVVYLACFGFLLYCNKTNPTETSFRDTLVSASNDVLLVNKAIRNSSTDNHITFIESCYNEGVLRYFSFGVVSVMWIDDYDAAVALYKSHCTYLQPEYLTIYQRVIDVGILNRWWFMRKMMRDYDVNPNEWHIDK